MFGMQHTLKQFFGGIAIAAVVAVVAVPSAFSMTVITDTLGGSGSSKATPDAFERAVAIHNARAARQLQGVQLITDTLGGNGHAVQPSGSNPVPYVNGGMTAAVAQSNETVPEVSSNSPYQYGGDSAQLAQPTESPYVYGGNSPQFTNGIAGRGHGLVSTPSVTANPSGSGIGDWGLAGLAAGLAAALLVALLFLGGPRPRQHRRGVRTA